MSGGLALPPAHDPIAEAFTRSPSRWSRVHEREVLRVAATIVGEDVDLVMEDARHETLVWAQNRCGGHLPDAAWQGQEFEHILGGRTTVGARIHQLEGSDVWALRGEDPDKRIAGRTWTTEVAIGRRGDDAPKLSLRLLVASDTDLVIEPAVPGLLRQIADKYGLMAGGYHLSSEPWHIKSRIELDELIVMLQARDRILPIFVASGDERSGSPNQPLIDAVTLSRTTVGLAHVVVLPAEATYSLSETFGKVRSVFHGAVRIYTPDFDTASNPSDHRLILAESIRKDPSVCLRHLRQFAATESLRRTRLGHDVMSFASVRSVALRVDQAMKANVIATDSDRLGDARKRIDSLELELSTARLQADLSFELAQQEEERAKLAAFHLYATRSRITQLETQLSARGQEVDSDLKLPESWSDFADWCDIFLIDRVVLTPLARIGIKKATFTDIALAARSLRWLAVCCRDRRINGGGSLANITIEQGVENAPCGSDTFSFDLHGRKFEADWHIKTGGNTRDPCRCLRIYYAWDETSQQIIVADMPSHRRSGAT